MKIFNILFLRLKIINIQNKLNWKAVKIYKIISKVNVYIKGNNS